MRSILQHCGDYSESGPHAPFSLSHFRLRGARGRTWFRAPLFTTLLNCVRDACRSAQQVGYFVSFRHATTFLGSGSLHGPGSAQGARDLAHLAFSLVHGPGRHTPATRFATRPSILVFSTRNRGAQFSRPPPLFSFVWPPSGSVICMFLPVSAINEVRPPYTFFSTRVDSILRWLGAPYSTQFKYMYERGPPPFAG